MNCLDVAFVGGGFSTTMTLAHLIRELADGGQSWSVTPSGRVPLRIAVFDRDGDFGCGVPYGKLAHPMFLLNENVATMNFNGFLKWLSTRREIWLGLLRSTCSPGVFSWLSYNAQALEAARTDPASYLPLYFPRCIFGLFIQELLHAAIADARRALNAGVDLVHADVISIERQCDGTLAIRLANGATFSSRLVVLALGSLSSEASPGLEGAAGYIHDLLRRSPVPALSDVRKALQEPIAASRCIVILGSNAAAMEAVYAIRNDNDIAAGSDEIVLISHSGYLPDGTQSERQSEFTPRHLEVLVRQRGVSAQAILHAAENDAECGRRAGYTSLDYSGPISRVFSEIFGRLCLSERRRFVEECGARFTALNRRTPPEYAAAAEFLKRQGRIRVVRAPVTAVERLAGPVTGFTIHATDAGGARVIVRAAAVIDCRGSGRLLSNQMPLLRSILRPDSGIARINGSKSGIAVNANFEASPGVCVMGPLLSGHSTRHDAIWNLESAPRIHCYSEKLARILASKIYLGRVHTNRSASIISAK